MIDNKSGLFPNEAVGFRIPLGIIADATIICAGMDMNDRRARLRAAPGLGRNFLWRPRDVPVLLATAHTIQTGFDNDLVDL